MMTKSRVDIERATRMSWNPGKQSRAVWRVLGTSLNGKVGMIFQDPKASTQITLTSMAE